VGINVGAFDLPLYFQHAGFDRGISNESFKGIDYYPHSGTHVFIAKI